MVQSCLLEISLKSVESPKSSSDFVDLTVTFVQLSLYSTNIIQQPTTLAVTMLW